MIKKIKNFFQLEAATGILLALTTIAALFIANSNFYQSYHNFLEFSLPIDFNLISFYKNLTVLDWINDALMAIFFFLIGLELKKEVLVGEISSRKKIILPVIAAFGGVIIPALIFCYFNFHNHSNLRGFAIPTATDIAFAYGAISLFGKKFSHSLKVFLVALAVIDDLIAILIIAIFYSQEIDAIYILFSFITLFGLLLLNLRKSNKIYLYLILGICLWLMILKSGIHATLAGVLLSLFIPLKISNKNLLENLAHKIAPAVNFLILPIFAFANAGVRINNFSLDVLLQPLILGVVIALFFGKQIGVMLFSFLAIKLKIATLPRGTSWSEFYVAAIFTGIGFTMSLFIGALAFFNSNCAFGQVKVGVLIGSLLSIIYGFMVACFVIRKSYNKK